MNHEATHKASAAQASQAQGAQSVASAQGTEGGKGGLERMAHSGARGRRLGRFIERREVISKPGAVIKVTMLHLTDTGKRLLSVCPRGTR